MTLSIEARAAHWPDRTAAVDVSEDRRYAPAGTVDEDRVSYAGLAAAIAAVRDELADLGVGPGDVVGALSRNRVACLALFFACRRLGATYAPISHRLTPATVEEPLERLDPTTVVFEPALRDLVRQLPTSATVSLDSFDVASEDRDPEPSGPESPHDAAEPALALHDESGTSVARFDEATVERNCVAAATTWGLGGDDRTTLVHPLSSAAGLLRVALPLLYVGGTLAIDRAFDPDDSLEAIRREGATFLAGPAGELRDLLERAGDGALSTVDWAAVDGPVDASVRDAVLERGVTPAAACGPLACPNALAVSPDRAAANPGDAADGLVGRPVLDCDARLVDDRTMAEQPEQSDVVAGAGTGRLEVRGPVVADGVADGDAATDAGIGDWLDTGERLRRDDDGAYYRPDG